MAKDGAVCGAIWAVYLLYDVYDVKQRSQWKWLTCEIFWDFVWALELKVSDEGQPDGDKNSKPKTDAIP